MSGSGDDDAIRLTSGDVIRGRIVEENARAVMIERENMVSSYPRGSIYGIDYSKKRWQDRRQSFAAAEPVPSSARPSTTWLPRTDPRDPVKQTEVLFHDTHAPADCLGPALTRAHQELPDLRLFIEPGGRLVLHDPKQWGYHAHLPGGALRIPAGKPGLSIDLPKNDATLPETVAFVSPAQEIKVGERTSYALPDAVFAVLQPIAVAEAMLAAQPFAGGRALSTPNGTMWAFTLPRNSRQFFVYLLDPQRRHGEILKAAYVGFGDTILAADLMIDVVGADGVALGRVLAVPFPDHVSADGPAREPLVVYAGPLKDPTAIATLALPPREAVQLPPKTSSTKADILVSHYEVSPSVPQQSVLAHGVGRPTKDVSLAARAITAAEPDQIVKIDLSSLPEERFPAVVWLYQRRTFQWKTTGGYLAPATALPVPPLRETKLAKVKQSDAIPHVLPLLFTGPKPATLAASSRGWEPAADVAGGMANGLMREALSRESGGLGSLTQNITPQTPSDGPGNISNTTYVYITSPPHTPAADFAPSTPAYGMYYPVGGGAPYGAGTTSLNPNRPAGYAPMITSYDPATGTVRPK
jgi:hypothetical protein